MSTAVSTRNGSGHPPVIDRELVRRTVAKDATSDELELYLYDCQRRNVHPLDKLLHFTKRGGRYTPVTSIDLMRSRAADTGQLAGSDDAIFETGGKTLILATVTVYRLTQGQRFAYTATARWNEYNAGGPMWQKMPHTMLAKCAEALALRKAFPQELAGLYSADEMDQAADPAPRQNPHVTRPEDITDIPATDSEDWFPPASDGIKTLSKKDARPIGETLNKEMHAITDVEQLRKWKKSIEGRVQVLPDDWRETFSGRYKEYRESLANKVTHDPETGEVKTDTLAEIDRVLSMVTDPGMLDRTWEFQCEPRIEPHMYDDAMAILRKHEARLS